MYLFCVQLDLALEQTAGLIGREAKGLYLSTATRLTQPSCLCSLLCHPSNASRAFQWEWSVPTIPLPSKVVILHRDYPSPGHGFLLGLATWEMTGPILLPSSILFLLPWSELKKKKNTVCVAQVWICSLPEKQVQSSAQELDVKTQYFSAGHFFKYVMVIVIFSSSY